MAGKFHYDGPVNPRFPRIGGPCVAEIMETEILYSRLLQGIGQSRLNAFQGLFVIREDMVMGDVPYLSDPFQNFPDRAVKIDVSGIPGLCVLGFQYGKSLFQVNPVPGEIEYLASPHASMVAYCHNVRNVLGKFFKESIQLLA